MFGVRCPGCGRPGWCPCPQCADSLEPAPVHRVAGVDVVSGLFAHRGRGRQIVSAFKHRDQRAVASWLADGLVGLAAAQTGVDLVTWVPASPHRRAHTGHDAGRALARAVGRRLGVPARQLLTRRRGPAQTGLPRTARLRGPPLALRRTALTGFGDCALAGRCVLVVDDVVTTGASLATAAGLLRSAGARSVVAAAVAVRPCQRAGPVQ
jgi:predicted amidophosphoribosyltransferase